jgi:hypothetical protein
VAGTCLLRSCSFPELFVLVVVLVVLGAGERFRCVPFLPLRQWQWPCCSSISILCDTATRNSTTGKEESPVSTKPTNKSCQLRIEGYSILPALEAVSRLGYLVSYRSDMRCECCLAWPDLTSTLTFRCWMRYGYDAGRSGLNSDLWSTLEAPPATVAG